jgi:hypothetical protein
VRPIWIDSEDRFVPWTARKILRHNEQWQVHCGEQTPDLAEAACAAGLWTRGMKGWCE